MQITPIATDAYSGRISASFDAASDVTGDGEVDGDDCTANLVVRADTDSNGFSDMQLFSMVSNEGGLGFLVLPAGIDALYVGTSGVGVSESCEGTVVLMLDGTAT